MRPSTSSPRVSSAGRTMDQIAAQHSISQEIDVEKASDAKIDGPERADRRIRKPSALCF